MSSPVQFTFQIKNTHAYKEKLEIINYYNPIKLELFKLTYHTGCGRLVSEETHILGAAIDSVAVVACQDSSFQVNEADSLVGSI